MRRNLQIGESFTLPPDVIDKTVIVYGGKGMGKTNFAAVLCEELSHARLRFSVLDPLGVLYGLRHAKDGKGRGIEVLILGGKHGDIPIDPMAGSVVADLVADEDVDVVIDISRSADGKMWSLGQRIRFVTDYCSRLYERQGERRRPIMQIIDEAGRYCPQEIRRGQEQISLCVGAIEQMVEEGRNVGIGVCLITQRSARMNKSVSELADCMIAFRTVGPRSIDAIVDWFGEHVDKSRWKDLIATLRALPIGGALVVSPGWLQLEETEKIRVRQTFDSSKSPTAGRERRTSGPGAKPDLARYVEKMGETIERTKAEDPKELRRKLAEARMTIAKLEERPPAAAPAPRQKTKEVRVPIISEKELRRLEVALVTAGKATGVVKSAIERAERASSALETSMAAVADAIASARRTFVAQAQPEAKMPPLVSPPGAVPYAVQAPVAAAKRKPKALNGHATTLLDPESAPKVEGKARTMLGILIHCGMLTKEQVAVLAVVKRTSSTFRTYWGQLSAPSFVEPVGAGFIATEQGKAFGVPPWTMPATNALVEEWCRHALEGKAKDMLRRFMDVYPRELTKHEIGQHVGVDATSSTFRTYFGQLTANGLVEKRGNQWRASPSFFLNG
jgi:hypothetical protein